MSEIEEQEALEQSLVEETPVLEFDFEGSSDASLLEELKKMSTEEVASLEVKLKAIQDTFWSIYNDRKEQALSVFLGEGGTKEGFEYKDDDTEGSVKRLLSKYSEQIKSTYREQKEQLLSNLKKKSHLLDQLRDIVQGDETASTFDQVKSIQEEWKNRRYTFFKNKRYIS
jgi:hypothetical protein